MDEMEMSINRKAVKSSWIYGLIFLLVWVIYDFIRSGSYNGIAFILLSSQMVIYWTVDLFLKWKLGKDEK